MTKENMNRAIKIQDELLEITKALEQLDARRRTMDIFDIILIPHYTNETRINSCKDIVCRIKQDEVLIDRIKELIRQRKVELENEFASL